MNRKRHPPARLQALQAIPVSKRTDAEWDELNELEILLASGNRQAAPEQGARKNPQGPGAGPPKSRERRIQSPSWR